MTDKFKYIFVVRQLCSGGAENATILLGKKLSSEGYKIEIWNTGKWSFNDSKRWISWSKIKQISKFQLLFYKKKSNELLILVNNVGHKYAPIDSAISILHGDCTADFYESKSYTRKIKELLKIKYRYSKRQNIIISKNLSEKLQPFAIKPVIHIPNPFDKDYVLEHSNDKLTYNLPKNFIIHVGRISYEKNQAYLLQEYLDHTELNTAVDLVFVGSEASKKKLITQQLQSIVENHPLKHKVHFLGDVQNPFPIIKRAKCLVLCSKFESMGYVLLEAMALEIPIISTDNQGPRDVLGKDFIGILKMEQLLSYKIKSALNDPDSYKVKLPQEYNLKEVVTKFEKFTHNLFINNK